MDVDGLIQSALAHYGVKGMKWGVRRDTATREPGVVSVHQKKPGGKVETTGGHGVPAHADAVKAMLAKQVAKTSGTHALSNKELQDLITRMNLEQQYVRLTSSGQTNAGQKFAKELLTQIAKQQLAKLANDAASKQVGKLLK